MTKKTDNESKKKFNKETYFIVYQEYISFIQKASPSEKQSNYQEHVKLDEIVFGASILYNQVIWNNRKTYISLIEDYLTKKIDIEAFEDSFLTNYRKDNNNVEEISSNWEKLSKFQIDETLPELSDLIELVFSYWEALDLEFNPEDKPDYDISEDQFRDALEKIYNEIYIYQN